MDQPARALRHVLEPVATLNFYSDQSTAAYHALGLQDYFPAYFAARSSPMGRVEPAVVSAVFGVWAPGLVDESLAIARRTCTVDEIRQATEHSAAEAAREVLAKVEEDEIAEVVDLLQRGVDAADDTARPLFAGYRAWREPADAYAGLWRVTTTWRELRGDSHLLACAVHGVSGLQANLLTELQVGYPLGEYTATREWTDTQIAAAAQTLRERGLLDGDALSESGRRLREEIEQATDRAVEPAVAALGRRPRRRRTAARGVGRPDCRARCVPRRRAEARRWLIRVDTRSV